MKPNKHIETEAIFNRLVREHYRSAFNFAYRITGNTIDAEDLVQESFLRAYRFFSKYNSELPFSSWLYKIMLNANVDLLRRKGKLRTTSLDANLDLRAEGGSLGAYGTALPDEQMLRNTMEEPLQKSLLSLSSQFRTAVLLADVEGLSYEEIAKVMRTSVGTVRSRVHRGRKQLKRSLIKGRSGAYGELIFEL